MSIYAIGDVQGCYDELLLLLEKIGFDQNKDVLWFTGDLVNRGPRSLDVLRFVRGLGNHAVTVLGNHDLHCLAVFDGVKKLRDNDSLDQILRAPDGPELMLWLRYRPLLHVNDELHYVLVHAGIYPEWTLPQAQQFALEVETALQGDDFHSFLQNIYGNTSFLPAGLDSHWDRLRFITNCFTRMRYCDANNHLDLIENQSPDHAPKELTPWYQVLNRKKIEETIVVGHWASLGLMSRYGVLAIDTGCVWKGALTAIKLGHRNLTTSVSCTEV